MRTVRRASASLVFGVLCAVVVPPVSAQDDPAPSAKTWLDRAAELEEYLKWAEVIEIEEIGTGVTKPMRAILAHCGPVDAFAWKDEKPGIYRGYRESYKSEVGAYELDKLLELGMTPPAVERRVRGDLGAAVLWVGPAESWKDLGGPPTPPAAKIGYWNYQLIRAKMFHNLIGNRDPNLGNWLVDPAWNLILIDNSRAFTTDTDARVHELTRVDRDLWARIAALDAETLTSALGDWLDAAEIEAILARRDAMRSDIEKLVEARGESQVFVHFGGVPGSAQDASQPRGEPPAVSDEFPAAGGDQFLGQLVYALDETPVLMPRSELIWLGTVVRLSEYEGVDAAVARAGVDSGYTFGLITDIGGLICLSPNPDDPVPHADLGDLVGQEAEVFGFVEEADGMTVAYVTLCRRTGGPSHGWSH